MSMYMLQGIAFGRRFFWLLLSIYQKHKCHKSNQCYPDCVLAFWPCCLSASFGATNAVLISNHVEMLVWEHDFVANQFRKGIYSWLLCFEEQRGQFVKYLFDSEICRFLFVEDHSL